MKYENSIVKDYILRSFEELIRGSAYMKPLYDTCEKIEIRRNDKFVRVDAFVRSKFYDDESAWYKHYSRNFSAGQILTIMETENRYESTNNKCPIGDYAFKIWSEIRNSRDDYYKSISH